MYITITAQKLGGQYSQSAGDFVEYLEKENQGLEQEEMEHFFNQYGDEISATEVVKEIDGNKAKLKKKEPKFYSLTVSPSKYELRQLQNNRENLKQYTRAIMKDYAASFNREIDIKLMPISIDKLGIEGKTLDEVVLDRLLEGKKTLRISRDYSIMDAMLLRDYDAPGYGVITPNERNAVKILAQNEGILLDPVYSGRAFYGMLDHLENKKIEKGSNVLFWHTGGLPANFYYSRELLED